MARGDIKVSASIVFDHRYDTDDYVDVDISGWLRTIPLKMLNRLRSGNWSDCGGSYAKRAAYWFRRRGNVGVRELFEDKYYPTVLQFDSGQAEAWYAKFGNKPRRNRTESRSAIAARMKLAWMTRRGIKPTEADRAARELLDAEMVATAKIEGQAESMDSLDVDVDGSRIPPKRLRSERAKLAWDTRRAKQKANQEMREAKRAAAKAAKEAKAKAAREERAVAFYAKFTGGIAIQRVKLIKEDPI